MLGVIGGSGFYTFFGDDARTVSVDTPYGTPSAPITIGAVGGHEVAFLPRHGLKLEYSPHTVPYRANLWALRKLGVRRIFAPCAVGEPGILEVVSLLPRSYPGHCLLTEDEGRLLGEDDCPCGRKGKYFEVLGRLANAEIRGCSDTYAVPT